MTDELIPVEEAVQPVDGLPYFELVEERFGIPVSVFEPYLVFQPNKQNLWIVDRALRIPPRPEHHTVGMPFFYVNMRFPRLTTLSAVKFGHLAVRNVFDARGDEAAKLLHRHEIRVDEERAASMTGHGYVVLRRHGLPIGLGFFHPEDDGDWLRGMLPRSWVVRSGIPSPVVPELETVEGATWESDLETAPGS